MEAWDTRLHRNVAIKCLPRSSDEPAMSALHEARMTAGLRHPAFAVVYEVLQEPKQTCLVMERIEGRTLGQIGAAGRASEAEVIDWGLQCAEAMQVAHDMGVVHGDIKPSNLMLDPQGRLRILDLGISRWLGQQDTMGGASADRAVGTLAYMAPEQILGAHASVSSDIYALGVTLYELLSPSVNISLGPGKQGGAFSFAQRRLHAELQPDRDSVANEALFELLVAMTQRDPARRPRAMSDVATVLKAQRTACDPPAWSDREPASEPATRVLWGMRRLLACVLALAVMPIVTHLGTLPDEQTLRAVEMQLRVPDDVAGLDHSISVLEGALESARPAPARLMALLSIAYCLRYAGNARDAVWLDRAESAALLATAAEDQLAVVHAARAWVFELRGQPDAARTAYERALTLDPTEFYALNGLAQLELSQQRLPQAAALFERALHDYPDAPTFLNGLGTTRYLLQDLAAAEAAFRRSVAVRPRGTIAYANLNAVLTRLGRSAEALAVLQQGLSHGPDARLYCNLGTTLFVMGRYVEAAEAFERALSADKGSPNDYRNWANLADALRMVPGQRSASDAAYRRAIALMKPQLKPGADATIYSRAGLYASKVGDTAMARRWTEAALAALPANADVQFRAAVVAELALDRAAALRRLQGAIGAGFPAHLLQREPELASLRRDRRFHDLMNNIQGSPP